MRTWNQNWPVLSDLAIKYSYGIICGPEFAIEEMACVEIGVIFLFACGLFYHAVIT
jgi:hypothetical protein